MALIGAGAAANAAIHEYFQRTKFLKPLLEAFENDILPAFRQLAQVAESVAQDGVLRGRAGTRALEILRDNKRMEWKRDYGREEQKIIDDVSQNNFSRKFKTAGRPYD